MDIVPTPSSNPAPQFAIQPVNPQPDTTAYSPTPALDALKQAYQNGLIQTDDIQKLVQGGSDTAKKVAVNSADIQAAGLRKQSQPAETAAAIGKSQADLQADRLRLGVQPVAATAAIAGLQPGIAAAPATTAAAQSTAEAGASGAARQAELSKLDPSGGLSSAASLLSGFAIPTPTNSDGSVNVPELADWGQKVARYKTLLGSGVYPELMKDAAGKQGGIGLLFNPDGTMKDPQTAGKDVASALPQLTADERSKALSQLSMVQNVTQVLPHALSILNNANPRVGRALGQGEDITRFVNEARAKLGSDPAIAKLNDQQVLEMFLANNIQSTIRSLAGSGNRVMQAEVNPKTGLFYKAMPDLDASPSVWKTWLGSQMQLMKSAAVEASAPLSPDDKAAFDKLAPTIGAQIQSLGDEGSSATPAPQATAAPVKAVTPDQISALPVGQPYWNARGVYCIKTAPAVAPAQ